MTAEGDKGLHYRLQHDNNIRLVTDGGYRVVDQSYLKSQLSYDPESGEFRWLATGTGRRLDRPAGRLDMGHLVIRLDGEDYPASRLAWIYVYGELPEGATRMRFIDGNSLNCRIDNLRLEGAHLVGTLQAAGTDVSDDRRRTLTQAELMAILRYEPDTGNFYWREFKHGRKMDQPAGTPWSNGSRSIRINGIDYMAQRLAWLYVHGEFPSGGCRVKPIDGNPLNTRIANLRLARTKKEADAHFRAKYPHKGRDYNLRRYQGMSQAAYDAMLAGQKHLCAACGRPETMMRLGAAREMCVDHDHVTKAVRGIVCNACNSALGFAKDDTARLRALADYIDRHAAERQKLRSA